MRTRETRAAGVARAAGAARLGLAIALLWTLGACDAQNTAGGVVGDGDIAAGDVTADGQASAEVGAGDAAATDVAAQDAATEDGAAGTPDVTADAAADAEPDVPDVVTPPAECGVQTLVDGEVLTITSGTSEPLHFDVPAGTISVHVTAVGADRGVTYALDTWIGPDGLPLIDGSWMNNQANQSGMCMTCAVRVAPSSGAVAAITPNNPKAFIAEGDNSFRVKGFITPENAFGGGVPTPANTTVKIYVLAKVLPALPDAGVINFNLHFTGAQGWTADTAEDNADLQAALARVAEIYAQVGIAIGTVRYYDVDPKYQVIESIDGKDSDLMEMWSTTADEPADALNVFFVDELTGPFGNFGLLLGIAGGIPGPGKIQGTSRSGVAIAIKPNPQVPVGYDTTMAHECGHYLGLYHTIEQNFGGYMPTVYDPLPDTPETDDQSWLMHNMGAGDKLSPWQGIVMRSNPWVCTPADAEAK